jgi:hypothetical protein
VAIATAQRDTAERLAHRLQSLAEENKALLTRAIAAQSCVIGVIARAAAPQNYGGAPAYGRGARPIAFAFVARA